MRYYMVLLIFISLLISPVFIAAQVDDISPASESDNEKLETPEDYYLAGKYSEAAKLFLQSNTTKKNRLTSYYNAARCFHQDYIDNQSLESLSAAVEGYYRVLDFDPKHHEALVNLELARLELEKQYENKQQDGQDSENQKEGEDQNDGEGQNDQQSDQQDDLSKLADEQQDLADSENNEENLQKQSSLTDRTEQARDQSEQNSQTRENLEQALEKQKEAMDQMSQGFEEKAGEAQQEAASLLEQAAQSASESQNQENSESLAQDLQSILNQEQARKQDKQDAEDMIRVEKNW